MKNKFEIFIFLFIFLSIFQFTKSLEKIDINTASLEDLTKIIHIGETRANEIIKLRPFYSLDDLVRVKGIGEKSVEDIKKEGVAFVDEELNAVKENEIITESKKEIILSRIDINTASLEDLTKIIHIGKTRANEIIKLRPFYSLDDLTRIKGIGEKSVEDIKKEGVAFVDEELNTVKENKIITESKKEIVLSRIDINTASLEELTKIIHIGEARANEIIKLRPFYSLDDLVRVKGIGEKSVEDIKKEGVAFIDENLKKGNKEKEEKILEEEKNISNYKTASIQDIPFNIFLFAFSISIFSSVVILLLKKSLK